MDKAEWDNKTCADLSEASLQRTLTEMAKIQAGGVPLLIRPIQYISIENLDETEVSND